MVFKPTEYLRPRSIEEAVDILARHGDSAIVVSGNITVNELAKRGMLSDVQKTVDIEGLGLSWIRVERSAIRLGAATTYADVLHHAAFKTPALMSIHEAVSNIHPDQVRNVGTVGGAICSAFPFLDLVIGLLPHDVELTIIGPGGERRVSLQTFVLAAMHARIGRGEILTEVTISASGPRKGSAFVKYGRTALDLAVVNCGVLLQLDEKSIVADVRVFAGGKGLDITTPAGCRQALVGNSFSDSPVERACAALAEDLPAFSDTRGSAAFRRYTARRLLRDVLGTAFGRAATP